MHELRRRAPDPVPETTAPIDVKLRSVALVVIATASSVGLLYWASEVFIPIVLSVLVSYALDCRAAGTHASAARGRGGAGHQPLHRRRALFRLCTLGRRDGDGGGGAGVQRVQIEQPVFDIRGYLTWGSASLMTFAGEATLVVFFVFFLLASGDLVKRKLVSLAGPSFEKKKITVQILNEIDAHERGGDVYRPDLLEFRLGDLGHAARGADAGRREGVLRSNRRSQTDRRIARRMKRT